VTVTVVLARLRSSSLASAALESLLGTNRKPFPSSAGKYLVSRRIGRPGRKYAGT
jgi:hypothetical protein